MTRSRCYTIIELLIVVGIMALLMSVSMPAFSKIVKGNGVTYGSRSVAAKINACRSYAVTKRISVALVMPWTDTAASIPSICHNSYRVAIVTYNDSSSRWDFVHWVDGESWNQLPTGTLIYDDTSAAIPSTFTTVYGCVMTDVSSSASNVDFKRCVIFKPGGGLANAGSPNLNILEATYGGGSITTTNSSNKVVLGLNQYTGRISYN